MNTATQAQELHAAILSRAKALADETIAGAKREAGRILEQANRRLHGQEELEMARIKAMAERVYRQRVQASEIKMRSEQDQLKWAHVQTVMDTLNGRLKQLVKDDKVYLPLLQQLLVRAAGQIPDDELIAEVSPGDYRRLQTDWDSFVREVLPGKRITLSPECQDDIGGVLVHNADNSIRVDNCFEGRIARLRDELQRLITERLFASAASMGALFNG